MNVTSKYTNPFSFPRTTFYWVSLGDFDIFLSVTNRCAFKAVLGVLNNSLDLILSTINLEGVQERVDGETHFRKLKEKCPVEKQSLHSFKHLQYLCEAQHAKWKDPADLYRGFWCISNQHQVHHSPRLPIIVLPIELVDLVSNVLSLDRNDCKLIVSISAPSSSYLFRDQLAKDTCDKDHKDCC